MIIHALFIHFENQDSCWSRPKKVYTVYKQLRRVENQAMQLEEPKIYPQWLKQYSYKQLRREEIWAAQFWGVHKLAKREAFPEHQQAKQEEIQASQEFHLIENKILDTKIEKEEQIVEVN